MPDSLMLDGGFEIAFFIAFLVLLGVGALLIVRRVARWRRGARQPCESVPAVVSARCAGHDKNRPGRPFRVSFQAENGDRLEFSVPMRDYERMAVGDSGMLTFRGRRYLSFERAERPG